MRFFFYGTLIEGSDNPVARAIHCKLYPLGRAEVRGRLFAVADPRGWYPVLLPGRNKVHGMLYETRPDFGADDLARLDSYEDFDPNDPGRSLYRRVEIAVIDASGVRGKAHAYLYNRPLAAGELGIPGGDFRAWLEATGFVPFGGSRTS